MSPLVAGISLNIGSRAAGVAGVAQRDQLISLVLLLGLAAYLFLALKRVYGDGMIRAAARSLALIVLFLPIPRAYRLLLFFVTLKTMH